MQNFKLSVEKNRIPHFYVFQNRTLKYRKILYVVNKKPCIFALLNLKLCRRGNMYTTAELILVKNIIQFLPTTNCVQYKLDICDGSSAAVCEEWWHK